LGVSDYPFARSVGVAPSFALPAETLQLKLRQLRQAINGAARGEPLRRAGRRHLGAEPVFSDRAFSHPASNSRSATAPNGAGRPAPGWSSVLRRAGRVFSNTTFHVVKTGVNFHF